MTEETQENIKPIYHFTSSVSMFDPRDEKRSSFYKNSSKNNNSIRERVLTITISRKGANISKEQKNTAIPRKYIYSTMTVEDIPPEERKTTFMSEPEPQENNYEKSKEQEKSEKRVQIQVNNSESSYFEEEDDDYDALEENEIEEEEEEKRENEKNPRNEIFEEEEDFEPQQQELEDQEINEEEEEFVPQQQEIVNHGINEEEEELVEEISPVKRKEEKSPEKEDFKENESDMKHSNVEETDENQKQKANEEKRSKSRLKIHAKLSSSFLQTKSCINDYSKDGKKQAEQKRRPSQRPEFRHKNQTMSLFVERKEEEKPEKTSSALENQRKSVSHVSFVKASPLKKREIVDVTKPIDFSFRKPIKPPKEIEVFSKSSIDASSDSDEDETRYTKRRDRSTFYDKSYVPDDEKVKDQAVQTVSHQKLHSKSRVSSIIRSCQVPDSQETIRFSRSMNESKKTIVEDFENERARKLQVASTTPLKERRKPQKEEDQTILKSPSYSPRTKNSSSSPFETLVSQVNVRAPLAPSPDKETDEVIQAPKEKLKSFIPKRQKSKIQVIASPPVSKTRHYVESPKPLKTPDFEEEFAKTHDVKRESNDFCSAQRFAPGYLPSLVVNKSSSESEDLLESCSSEEENARETEVKLQDKIESVDDSLDDFLLVEEEMKKDSSAIEENPVKSKSGMQLTFYPIEKKKVLKEKPPKRKIVTPNLSRILKMVRTRVAGGKEFREISVQLTQYKHEHLVILVTPPLNTLEGIYTLDEESQVLTRVWGDSRANINGSEVTRYMAFNNETKDFDEIQATKLTQDTDVISI